ncbi:N-acetylmuramoyl-L-alanine amidase [Streptomyces sp. NPDC058045]|uniref:N-acetylmuramoyl-L-alanine amidase n=1 Tax=Streptomyces sp. NPDC058045 TaxID=3346311 RepID=UPI0036E578EA
MSYAGPEFEPESPPRRSRRHGPMAVAAATLVPAALAGGIVWLVMGGPGEDASDAAAGSASPSASSPPSPESPAPSAGESGADKGKDKGDKGDDGGKDKGGAKETDKGKGGTVPAPAGHGPLRGKVVVIDPGHNLGNSRHTAEIARQVSIGTERKECDTTGTSTNSGYPEAKFTLDVARRLEKLLHHEGATVKFTQNGDRSWGPCVDERAEIGNKAHADAVVSVHADGSGTGNRGFHVILPAALHAGAADTRAIAGPSKELGERIVGKFVQFTGSAPSNYIGGGTGLDVRRDLGGLNLSRVPKVFVECGNMRDAKDAALLTSGDWRQKAARGLASGIEGFLTK